MEVYKLLESKNEFVKGSLGVYEDILSDGRMRLRMARNGIVDRILFIEQDLIEEEENARIDSDTGQIIFEGWYFEELGLYYGHESTALELCQHHDYKDLDEAYKDDFCYWTAWGYQLKTETQNMEVVLEVVEA